MTKGVQQRRGTASEHSTFKGQAGEVTVNTDRWTLVVQDGVTDGGYEHVSIAATQRVTNKVIVATQLSVSGISTFGDISGFNVTGVGSFGTNATVIIGAAGSTGTANQDLQVSGGAFISGNQGIGITNPSAKLHVVPTSTGFAGLFSGTTSEDMVRITQLGTGNALLVEDSANPDSTPFVVHSAGPVGTGTTSPGAQLHAQVATGGPAAVAGLFTGTTADNMVLISNASLTGNTLYVGLNTAPNTPGLIVGAAGTTVGFNTTGIGLTAKVTLGQGSATPFTAPLKFVTGPVNTQGEHGAVEFSTPNFYATGIATQRGVVVAPQYFVLTAQRSLAGATIANSTDNIFGRTVQLRGGEGIGTFRYAYELAFAVSKSSANAAQLGYGLTATTATATGINHHKFTASVSIAGTVGGLSNFATVSQQSIVTPNVNVVAISTSSLATAASYICNITGIVDISSPVVGFAPIINFIGGAPTTSTVESKAYMRIWPIGTVPTAGDFTGNSSWG